MTLWLRHIVQKISIETIYKNKNISIGYMSLVFGCKFGLFNKINSYISLSNVEMGDFTYVSDYTQMSNTLIGKFCSIGPMVLSGVGTHPTRLHVSTHPSFYSVLGQTTKTFVTENKFKETEPITIGNDVWVGARSIILDGVTIGDGAIIAAGSVVIRDVEPYSIVGGVPARLIRFRFDKPQINFLIQLKWWDKSLDWIQDNAFKFCNIDNLMQ